ncbi:MAG: hypothetical protein WC923_01135, partial [Bacteroidales bacterium]
MYVVTGRLPNYCGYFQIAATAYGLRQLLSGCGSYLSLAAVTFRLRRLLSGCGSYLSLAATAYGLRQLLSGCGSYFQVAAAIYRLRRLLSCCRHYFQIAAVTFLLQPLKRTGSFFVCRGSQFFFVAAIEISCICSFLILVDYLAVLSLGKVDSVYKLKLIIVDFSVLYLRFV